MKKLLMALLVTVPLAFAAKGNIKKAQMGKPIEFTQNDINHIELCTSNKNSPDLDSPSKQRVISCLEQYLTPNKLEAFKTGNYYTLKTYTTLSRPKISYTPKTSTPAKSIL